MTDDALDRARRMIASARQAEGGETVCRDDCVCPPGLTLTHHGVTVTDPVLVCNEPDGHPGPHVARGLRDDVTGSDVITSWPRGAGRAG